MHRFRALGQYEDSDQVVQSCWTDDNNADTDDSALELTSRGGATDWAATQSDVRLPANCKVECPAEKVWTSAAQIACIALSKGQYEDSDKVVQSCWTDDNRCRHR